MKKILAIACGVIALSGVVYFTVHQIQSVQPVTPVDIDEIKMREFLTQNISSLSSEKEVHGGKFYITEFTKNDNVSGVVAYEDGHMAYKAYVTFAMDKENTLSVTSFEIIE